MISSILKEFICEIPLKITTNNFSTGKNIVDLILSLLKSIYNRLVKSFQIVNIAFCLHVY